MSDENFIIEKDILNSFFNIRKKILITQDYSENIRSIDT